MKESEYPVCLGTRPVRAYLARKRMKNLRARVLPDGSLHISAPVGCPDAVIRRFLSERADVLLRHMDEAAATPPPPPCLVREGAVLPFFGETTPLRLCPAEERRAEWQDGALYVFLRPGDGDSVRHRVLGDYLRACGRAEMRRQLTEIHSLFAAAGVPLPVLTFRRMVGCWGNCHMREGRVALNDALVYVPRAAIAYVVAHELTHFLRPDHSPAFYRELSARMPDYAARRALLPRREELTRLSWL